MSEDKNKKEQPSKEDSTNVAMAEAATATATDNPDISSNASNYSSGASYQVDQRTGNLQVSLAPPTVPGFFGQDITPAIYYSHQSMGSSDLMLGLPLGWSYHFSFIADSRVFINGQQSYYIDSQYESGMRYYNLKGTVFEQHGAPIAFPYDKSLSYVDTLSFYNGDIQYFDPYGRLVGMEDRFGNHVIFYYNKSADVYSSKITKIINSFGQAITFTYSSTGITIAYPQSTQNNITFTYLISSTSYLTGYINPLGQQITITNKGGLARNDLVSQISQPNGLVVNFTYSTIKFYDDPSKQTVRRLDCVATVQGVYQGEKRTTSYNYDPNGDAHNFTGYPLYNTDPTKDVLLQSNNNSYNYVSTVDDGVFVTHYTYNHLHLEMETQNYTKDSTPVLVSSTINSYPSETSDQCFPTYQNLPANYQTPTKTVTNYYDEGGKVRSQKSENTFDDYGNPTVVKTYQADDTTNDFFLVSIEETSYYDYETCYGQGYQQKLTDYTKNNLPDSTPIVRMSENTLTADNKNIAMTTNGFVENSAFKPSKKSTYKYNSAGKITYQSLEWNDGQQHALQSTSTSTTYAISIPTITITSIDAQNNATTTLIDSATGWIISQTNPLGSTVSFTYDNIGRTLTTTSPTGIVTKYVYDDINNKVTTLYANGYKSYTYYNGFGNQLKSADNMGPDGTERVLGTQVYNEKNQLIQTEGILGANSRLVYTYNSKGQGSTVTDALGNVTSYTYDAIEQMSETFFNGIKVNKSSYNQNVSTTEMFSSINPSVVMPSTQSSNAYGTTIQSIIGDPSSKAWNEINYFLDSDLNVSSFTSTGADGIVAQSLIDRDLFANSTLQNIQVNLPNGGGTSATRGDTYIYNNLNQLIEDRNALGQSYTYSYNAAGMQVTYTDYAGTVFTSTYNANNLVTSVSYKDSAGKLHEKKFSYYPLTGLVQSIEDFLAGTSCGALQYTYTLDNNLESVTYPDGKQIYFKYDTQTAQLYQFKDALGNVTQYTYDDYGRIIQLQQVGTTYAIYTNYYTKQESAANSGQIKSITTSNGIKKTFTYTGFGSIETITITDTTITSGENTLLNMAYTYEAPSGNIVQITYTSPTSPQNPKLNYIANYVYNSLDQLLTEKTSDLSGNVLSTTSYSYDAANNITEEKVTDSSGQTTSTTYQYDADNKLLQVTDISGTRQLTYDINGNLLEDGAGSLFTYDERSNLVGYENKNTNVKATYTYYPDGLRATKQTTEDDLIRFYYDAASNPNIINEVQSSASTSYLMTGSARYIRIVQNNGTTTPQYFIDNLKDTIGILNEAQEFKNTYEYKPYGQEIDSAISTRDLNINDNPFQYTGEYTDPESMLIYLRSRYYDPSLKRFITRDMAMLVNRYAYADGNPIMNTDPSGQRSLSSKLAIAFGVIAIVAAVALTVATMGATTPVLIAVGITAGGLIGFGASSAIYGGTHPNNFNNSDYGIMTGTGAGLGMIGGAWGAGLGASTLSASQALGADVLFNTGLGAVGGYVTNGAINANHGVDFNTGGGEAAGIGAAMGFGTSATLGLAGRGVALNNSELLSRDGEGTLVGVTSIRTNSTLEPEQTILRIDNSIYVRNNNYNSIPLTRFKSTGYMRVPTRSSVVKFGIRNNGCFTINEQQFDTTDIGLVNIKVKDTSSFADSSPQGRYDSLSNNSTSTVIRGLESIGFKVPIYARTSWTITWWLRSLSNISNRVYAAG